ncbi:MAG TPA: DUF4398 domain-containing protein [Polyangia bacterium]|jgi:hypothetical protein|nr:DUF4398 domain-containing protein [Polyangia bacterium]
MRRPEGLLSAVFLIAAGVATGCGPARYLANTPRVAAKEVAQAEKLDARRHAPYEFTAAKEYLHKARELAGYSRYQEAVKYAREATRLARAAQAMAKEKAGDAVDVEVTDAPESPPAQPQNAAGPKAPAKPETPAKPPAPSGRPKASPRPRDGTP